MNFQSITSLGRILGKIFTLVLRDGILKGRKECILFPTFLLRQKQT
jgi:hypothetical protein